MADKKHILTYTGLKQYEDELQDLKVNKRQEIAQKIKEAREQGDLSENAEYDAAKDEQRDIEARIEQLEKLLKNAEVVVEDEIDLEKINIGCRVKLLDVEEDRRFHRGEQPSEQDFQRVAGGPCAAWQEGGRRSGCRDTGRNDPVQGAGDPESIINNRTKE